jgi:hypothetical protein
MLFLRTLLRTRDAYSDIRHDRGRRAVLALTDQAKEVIKGIVEEVGPDGGLRITAAN